jgi:hypothetical protein
MVIGGKFFHVYSTHQFVAFSNWYKVFHTNGESHADKATCAWDGWSHVISSSGGGTSFTFKFHFNGLKPQGNVLGNPANTVTPLVNPTPCIKY